MKRLSDSFQVLAIAKDPTDHFHFASNDAKEEVSTIIVLAND
jgi:hypothetical protein